MLSFALVVFLSYRVTGRATDNVYLFVVDGGKTCLIKAENMMQFFRLSTDGSNEEGMFFTHLVLV